MCSKKQIDVALVAMEALKFHDYSNNLQAALHCHRELGYLCRQVSRKNSALD